MSANDLDFLLNGPVDLPPAITNEASKLVLFCEYLSHTVTQRAIIRAAGKNGKRVQEELCHIGGLNHGSVVRRLVTKAPSLAFVVGYARDINDPVILPENAIPSSACIDACVAAYHAWVKECSRR
ncbi:MAG TPA: hypothetical protein VFT87_04170 [Candidatus Saccharimonadales bacterium]|nr:hypothetical protein [Candidatus Saccharimonadales bacterium]